MMTTGEYMLQKIGRNVNNLAVRPHIFRGDAFSASLFACLRQRMIFTHDTDKGIVMEFLEGNVLGSKFGILDAQHQIQLTGAKPVQIGIGLVEGKFWHDVFIICQHLGENLADKPVGMGVGVANAEHRAFMLMECGNPFQRMVVESEHLLGIGEELKSYLRQGYGTGGTVKKLGAQLCFQTLNLSRYSWLGQGKLFSSFGVVQRLGQGSKTFKLLGIHPITSSRIHYVTDKVMITYIDTICA